nr:hypothetical protein [Tanacetum cinerariifolium]
MMTSCTHSKKAYNRLRLQDIKNMLILLVQENLDEVSATNNLERGRQGKSRSYNPGYWSITQEQKVNEEPGKIRWWEIVRRRPSAARKDHMIYHMMSSS